MNGFWESLSAYEICWHKQKKQMFQLWYQANSEKELYISGRRSKGGNDEEAHVSEAPEFKVLLLEHKFPSEKYKLFFFKVGFQNLHYV